LNKKAIGNKNSRKDNRMPTDRLKMELKQNPEKLKKIIQALIDKAISGDMAAIREVFDRVDGKVVNQVSAEVVDNSPIYVVTGIDPDTPILVKSYGEE
jgi:hypothetical protein